MNAPVGVPIRLGTPQPMAGTMRLMLSVCSRTTLRNDRSAALSRAAGQTITRGIRTVSGSTGRNTTPLPRRLLTQAGTRATPSPASTSASHRLHQVGLGAADVNPDYTVRPEPGDTVAVVGRLQAPESKLRGEPDRAAS